MAGDQSAQKGAGIFDNINDWLAQGKADLQNFGDKVAAAGRQTWAQSTSPGPLDQAAGESDPGFYARRAGNVFGVARGLLHMGEGTLQGAMQTSALGARIANPLDKVFSPPGQSAPDQMIAAANNAASSLVHGILDPASFGQAVMDKIHQLHVDVDPNASPPAVDPDQEQARNFKIGENQGELGVEGAALAFGGGAAKVLGRLGPISEAAKFSKLGFSDAQAARLAQPYDGIGHHFIPQSFTFPKTLFGFALPDSIAGQPLPSTISNSAFNVLKPKNISQGDFYELHSQVDPHFYGAKIGAKDGGGAWTAKQSQVEKYGLLGSLLFGSPAPLNAAVGTVGAAGLANYDGSDGD